ncbi:MAG: hypothetical protein ACJAZM_003353 [Cyclobacteriaceae bacterium]
MSAFYQYGKIQYILVSLLFIGVTALKAHIGYWIATIFSPLKMTPLFSGSINNTLSSIERYALFAGLLASNR